MDGAVPRKRGPRRPRGRARGPGRERKRLRRSRAITIAWRQGKLTFQNFLTRQVVSAAPETVGVLDFFDDWRAPAELVAAMPEYTPASVGRALASLVAKTLLVREGSREAERDELLATSWRDWLPEAGYHFATKDVPFASPRRWKKLVREFFAESPQPPIYEIDPARRQIPLPEGPAPDGEFLRVLLARETHREFSGEPVPLDRISELLRLTWGEVGELHSPNFGRLLRKTSPSGGARHPGEVYVVALDIDGLRSGLYHYNVRDHALEQIRLGTMRDSFESLAVGQRHVGRAAALFVMTALWPRSIWKYRSPRAYRVVTLDAGHLAQTFCLVATWLGLAPFTTAALRDTAIEETLAIDGITESVLYLAGVGMPRTRSGLRSGSPAAVARPRPRAGPRRRPSRA